MELRDLEKWVNEYELMFKMTMSSHRGCTVSVYQKGYDMPLYRITGDDCVSAISMIHHMLESLVKGGLL